MSHFSRIISRVFASIAGIIIIAIAAFGIIWRKEIKTVNSVKAVEGNPYLYTMEYLAQYDLDEVINSDIDGNTALLQYVVKKVAKGIPIKMNIGTKTGEFACTSFQAKNSSGEGFIYGRNYDFFKNPSLITFSHPENGYSSIAVSDMSHFGYSLDKLPGKLKDNILCIAAAYAPVDGMNEKGLCTSIMALPKQAARQESGKHKVGTTIIMRLFLDRCATVQEALDLLDNYDICHDIQAGSGYHYMVADAEGNCAVIEFDLEDGWKTMIVEKPEDSNYMLVTNHLIDPKYYTEEPDPRYGNPHSQSWGRYEKAKGYLESRNGEISITEAQECLSNVHWEDLVWEDGMVEDTQYSAVYDQQNLTLRIREWNNYGTTYTFNMKREEQPED